MLWHRQVIFKSRGDMLCSSAESRIWTRDPRHQFASRLNARWQTDWAIEDQAKTWTRQPVPMISEHSAHLAPLSVDFRTWLWRYTYLLLLISMLWHRQAIFNSKRDKLSSSAESGISTRDPRHQFASRLNARWQTDWAIEDQAKNLNSTARPYDQRAFSPLGPTVSWHSYIHTYIHTYIQTYIHTYIHTYMHAYIHTYIHVFCCWFRCSGTGKRYSNRKETSCLPLLKAGFEPKVSDTYSPADWMPADKPTELSRIKLKNLNSTARPYDQQAFSPLDFTANWLSHLALAIYMFVVVNFDALAQASDIRIERRQVVIHTCLLLLISMLWHRQAIFESIRDRLSSSAESRIRTWKSQGT